MELISELQCLSDVLQMILKLLRMSLESNVYYWGSVQLLATMPQLGLYLRQHYKIAHVGVIILGILSCDEVWLVDIKSFCRVFDSIWKQCHDVVVAIRDRIDRMPHYGRLHDLRMDYLDDLCMEIVHSIRKRCHHVVIAVRVLRLPRLLLGDSLLDDLCAVCMAPMHPDKARLTPCGHAFHDTCLKLAFRFSPDCPMCRRKLF